MKCKHPGKPWCDRETKKVRHCSGEVFHYAIVTSRTEYNPAADLTSAMSGHESKHYPFLIFVESESKWHLLVIKKNNQLNWLSMPPDTFKCVGEVSLL